MTKNTLFLLNVRAKKNMLKSLINVLYPWPQAILPTLFLSVFSISLVNITHHRSKVSDWYRRVKENMIILRRIYLGPKK